MSMRTNLSVVRITVFLMMFRAWSVDVHKCLESVETPSYHLSHHEVEGAERIAYTAVQDSYGYLTRRLVSFDAAQDLAFQLAGFDRSGSPRNVLRLVLVVGGFAPFVNHSAKRVDNISARYVWINLPVAFGSKLLLQQVLVVSNLNETEPSIFISLQHMPVVIIQPLPCVVSSWCCVGPASPEILVRIVHLTNSFEKCVSKRIHEGPLCRWQHLAGYCRLGSFTKEPPLLLGSSFTVMKPPG